MRTFWRIEMDYISVREAAQKWEISERRVQKLCEEIRIDGIQKFGRSWMIPMTAMCGKIFGQDRVFLILSRYPSV